MTQRIAVTAVILNYRTPKDAWACAESLLRQTMAERMEVLLVDNDSEDDSIQYLRNRARGKAGVRVLESARNIGYGRGNQMAIAQAGGAHLLIINPDNTLEPHAVETMLKAMEAHPDIGILAPKLLHEDGTVRESARRFPSPLDVLVKRSFLKRLFPGNLRRYLRQDANDGKIQDVDWVVGACMLIRKDAYDRLGGFDPRFFLFFEDTDLCRRMRAEGLRVAYMPSVTATDRKKRLSEGGFLSLFRKKTARIHLVSAMRYFAKWGTAR